MICAERPRFAEGADAEVPRKSISNKLTFYVDRQWTRIMRRCPDIWIFSVRLRYCGRLL
jgi:hypothetical protein